MTDSTAMQLVIGQDGTDLIAELVAGRELAPGVTITPVSLEITDPDFPLDQWLALGRLNGLIHRAINWWIGDWINFGESLYGEAAAQGIDAVQDRYKEAERITGLDHGTLMNIASHCRKIAKSRRRKELGFWIHAEVAPLEPEQQAQWLQKAIDETWTRAELRDAIREAKGDTPEPGPSPPPPAGGLLTIGERIEHAARVIYQQAQPTDDGYLVPPEAMAMLKEALGEE